MIVATVEFIPIMALTVMVYLLSSLRPLRVCDLMDPEMVSLRGALRGAEHLLTV